MAPLIRSEVMRPDTMAGNSSSSSCTTEYGGYTRPSDGMDWFACPILPIGIYIPVTVSFRKPNLDPEIYLFTTPLPRHTNICFGCTILAVPIFSTLRLFSLPYFYNFPANIIGWYLRPQMTFADNRGGGHSFLYTHYPHTMSCHPTGLGWIPVWLKYRHSARCLNIGSIMWWQEHFSQETWRKCRQILVHRLTVLWIRKLFVPRPSIKWVWEPEIEERETGLMFTIWKSYWHTMHEIWIWQLGLKKFQKILIN
jgi:hypothetical protein